MLVSAQVRYFDPSSRLLDRRTPRIGDRAEEERRKNGRRRPQIPIALDEARPEAQVLSAFRARPPAALPDNPPDILHPPASLGANSLWSLIDAVDGGGHAPPRPAAAAQSPTPEPAPASQAESLYLLLAQVIGDDEDEDDGSPDEIVSRL